MSETKFTPEKTVKITSKKSGFIEAELLWVAKKVIRKTVDRVWERHRHKLILKLQSLN